MVTHRTPADQAHTAALRAYQQYQQNRNDRQSRSCEVLRPNAPSPIDYAPFSQPARNKEDVAQQKGLTNQSQHDDLAYCQTHHFLLSKGDNQPVSRLARFRGGRKGFSAADLVNSRKWRAAAHLQHENFLTCRNVPPHWRVASAPLEERPVQMPGAGTPDEQDELVGESAPGPPSGPDEGDWKRDYGPWWTAST